MPTEQELIDDIRAHTVKLLRAANAIQQWDGELRRRATGNRDERVQAAEFVQKKAALTADLLKTKQDLETLKRHTARVEENDRRHRETLAAASGAYVETLVRARDQTMAATAPLFHSPFAWKAFAAWENPYWDPCHPMWGDGDLLEALRRGTHPLADSAHDDWKAPLTAREAHGIPEFLRIGTLRDHRQWDVREQPALVPFPGDRALVFKAGVARRDMAVQAIQSTILRALASFPQGKLQLTCLDPVGLGQNFAPFMFLADYDPRLVSAKAWAEPRQMEERLALLTENMETVIQTYLRNQYRTLADYNEQAGEVQEPYRLLVVYDFPTNFTESAARRLVSVAQNGPRCGIFTIVLVDPDKPLPHGISLADLENNAIVIAAKNDAFIWQDDAGVFDECALELDTPPDLVLAAERDMTIFGRVLMSVGAGAVSTRDVKVPLDKLYSLFRNQLALLPERDQRVPRPPELANETTWWLGKAEAGILIPLGQEGARAAQTLDLGAGDAHHVLIAGRIGSGKSILFQVMVTNIAMMYSPDEVQLYLIDLKEGVTFKTFAKHRLPHARVVAIKSEREYAMSVLNDLNRELEHRGDLFRSVNAQNLDEYRQHITTPEYAHVTPEAVPRIVLMVDEFHEFFTENDRIAADATLILDRLVRQGRSAGFNVILGSQTLAGNFTLPQPTMRQMGVRIALMCADADSRIILAEDNGEARQLTRPGQAIYNAANGRVEGNHRFQVAWLPEEERDAYLRRIRAKADAAGYSTEQIIFESDEPAALDGNKLLRDALAGKEPPRERRPAIRAWLGDPIAIEDPVAAAFRRDQGRNLLIVGQDEDAARAMMTATILSVAAQTQHGAEIALLDFSPADIAEVDYLRDFLASARTGSPSGDRRETPAIIAGLYAEVTRRTVEGLQREPPRFLILHDIHRARHLRPEEAGRTPTIAATTPQLAGAPAVTRVEPPVPDNADNEFGLPAFRLQGRTLPSVAASSPTLGAQPTARETIQQLATILRDGPEYGVHTIATCDTMASVGRVFERQTLGDFAIRVALQMSQNDSQAFITSPAANLLGPYRALLFDLEESRQKKFRPYALPPREWLEDAVAALNRAR